MSEENRNDIFKKNIMYLFGLMIIYPDCAGKTNKPVKGYRDHFSAGKLVKKNEG